MPAVLPKLDITQVQTNPAPGKAVPPGTVVTYKVTISPDAAATAGAANAALALALGSNLTLNTGSVVISDPNGGTDTVTEMAGSSGFNVTFGRIIALNAQPITVTYQATVSAAAPQNTSVAPTVDITYQNASPDELVYATNNVTKSFYQYDATTNQLTNFGSPSSPQDSVEFDGKGNLVFTGTATGLSLYNLSSGVSTLLVAGQGFADETITPDKTTVYYNGSSNGQNALYAYNLTTGTNRLVVQHSGGAGFTGLTFTPSGQLFASYGTNSGLYNTGGAGVIAQIDTRTGAIISQTAVLGNGLDACVYDAYTGHIFVTSAVTGASPNVWEVNPATMAVVHTYSIPNPRLDGISSDGKGNLFIARYHDAIVKLDVIHNIQTVVASTPQIDDTIPITDNPVFDSKAITTTPVGSGSISGTVFLDQNADGVKLAGDTPVVGATVQLLDGNGVAIAGKTATTDANGNYKFANLAVGSYAVKVTPPAGDSFSPVGTNASKALDSIVNGTGQTTPVAVAAGADTPNQNAGVYLPATLGGTVFNDGNDDGVKNGTDNGHAGVVVQLLDSTGVPIAGKTATTDAGGNYSFTGLKPGTYSVAVTPVAGDSFSPVGTNANPALDSVVNAAGKTAAVTLTSGQVSANNNAGLSAPGALSGTVFLDQNADGVKLAGDTPVAGATVQLLNGAGTPIAGKTTTTDASGNYSFGNLTPGSYAVAVTAPAGDSFSPVGTNANPALDSIVNGLGKTSPVAVTSGTTANQNAGVYAPVTLSGTVFNDGNDDGVKNGADNGHAGVVVQLLDSAGTPIAGKTATTDAGGNYSFTGLKPGTYSVAVPPVAGDSFSPVGNAAAPAIDSEVTAAGKTAPVTLTSGQTSANNNAGLFAPGALSGTVFLDQNADGVKLAGDTPIAGATVQLLNGAGTPIAGKTTTTDASGNYSFGGLAPGSYAVAVIAPAGDSFSPVGTNANVALDSIVSALGKTSPVAVANGATTANQSAGVYAPVTLSGVVFNDGNDDGVRNGTDNGHGGVTVQLLDGTGAAIVGKTAITAADGSYSFTGLKPGTYAVAVTPVAGDVFSPVGTAAAPAIDSKVTAAGKTAPVTLTSGQSSTGNNAGLFAPGALSGTVFLDQNADGVKLAGDTPVAGATVQLLNGAGTPIAGKTTTTDASGNYSFGGLLPGSYAVAVTAPAGDSFSPMGTNANAALDSIVSALGKTSPVAVTNGVTTANQNAGVYAPVALSGTVFQDTNGNGAKDAGDAPVAGDKVTLLDGAGKPTGLTATTDAAGNYSFTGLKPGTYEVSIAAPAGEAFSPKGTNANAAIDSVVDTVGKTLPVTLNSGQSAPYQNAGVYVPATISSHAFLDAHCDGTDDYGDPAFKGVTVKLYDGAGHFTGQTAITDANGAYSFGGLAPGQYQVQFVLPFGTKFTDGTPGTDSNVNPATGFSPVFTLSSGQHDTAHGAGFALTGGYANSPTTTLDATHTAIGGNGSGITAIGGSGSQNDIINGGAGNNILVGGGGSNVIESGTGTNLILGGCGPYAQIQSLGTNDFVFGGKGDDLIQAHSGNAFVAAGPGNQTIDGGGGTNVFIANANRGTITFNGGSFSNIAAGDTFVTGGHTTSIYNKGDGVLYIEDYDASKGDTLQVNGYAAPTAVGQSGAYEVLYFGPNAAVLLRATAATIATPNLGVTYSATTPAAAPLTIAVDANNYLTLTAAGQVTPVIGAPANPTKPGTVTLTQANPNYTGGDTATTVTGPGNDTVKLGSGNNNLTLGGYSNNVTVTDGNNSIQAGVGNNTITAGNGTNVISASGYSNVANVGTGNDTIDIGSYASIHAAGGNQAITLHGYSNMVFIGGSGASVIAGGLGNSQITTTGGSAHITLGGYSNVVTTGAASDTISDGTGYTKFVIGSTQVGQINGTETISNFSAANSVVDIVPLAAAGKTAAQLYASVHDNAGGKAELDIANGGLVIFQGLTASQLHLSNFQVG